MDFLNPVLSSGDADSEGLGLRILYHLYLSKLPSLTFSYTLFAIYSVRDVRLPHPACSWDFFFILAFWCKTVGPLFRPNDSLFAPACQNECPLIYNIIIEKLGSSEKKII